MTLAEILSDKKLSKLGDTYVNFVYSLALSRYVKEPVGKSVKSTILATALKESGLRGLLPKRIGKHDQADAAEALIVYAWLHGLLDINECVQIIEKNIEKPNEAFTKLLLEIVERFDENIRIKKFKL